MITWRAEVNFSSLESTKDAFLLLKPFNVVNDCFKRKIIAEKVTDGGYKRYMWVSSLRLRQINQLNDKSRISIKRPIKLV